MATLMGVRIAATGSYLPDHVVTNEDLCALGCDSDWIIQRTGISERRRAAANQSSSDLAYEAAIRCLESASVDPAEIDLIVVATMTPDHFTPSTACLLQGRLGCISPAYDVNAACAGFMYGLVTAANFVRTGAAKKALVIGSEVMSNTINPRDIKTYPLFGDGAGAALVVPDDANSSMSPLLAGCHAAHHLDNDTSSGFLAYTLGAEGCGAQMLCIPGGGSRSPLNAESLAEGQQFLTMDGRNVFKWAVRVVDDSCRDCLTYAGIEFSEVDRLILHQANIRIIESAVSDFGLSSDKVVVNLDRYGNTSAASIPIALDDVNRQGALKRGDKVLLCGFGAGLSWGTALMRW